VCILPSPIATTTGQGPHAGLASDDVLMSSWQLARLKLVQPTVVYGDVICSRPKSAKLCHGALVYRSASREETVAVVT